MSETEESAFVPAEMDDDKLPDLTAEAHFQEGVQLAKRKDFDTACRHLARALELKSVLVWFSFPFPEFLDQRSTGRVVWGSGMD